VVIARVAVVGLLTVLTVSGSAQQRVAAPPSADLVEIDVVVTDHDGQHVPGLKREDFEIKEDGKSVEIRTFVAVSSNGSVGLDDGRAVVVLLDDMSMSPIAANSIKGLANYIATYAGPGDDFSVIRLTNRNDEPYGDFESALGRIAEYQPSPVPFDALQATEDFLNVVTTVSRRFEDSGRRRKVLVCIGTATVCNILEPRKWALRQMWQTWQDAVSAAARANLSVYGLVSRRGGLSAGGVIEATGGELFASTSDLRPAVRRIWEDASRHYLLGYWPNSGSKDFHSIQVKVAGKGLRVLTRRVRGG
jgi:hypothetical protein